MTVHAPYDTLVGTKRMMASGVDQKTSEATVTEITFATNGLVSKEDLHREMQLQNEKIGNKILQAVLGGAGILAVAQLAIKAFGL